MFTHHNPYIFLPYTDTSPIVIDEMETGNYRKMSNRVWDAYPEYLISAFGLRLDIQLHQNSEFISKNIKVSCQRFKIIIKCVRFVNNNQ